MRPYKSVIYLCSFILASHLLTACDGADVRKAKYLEKGKTFIQEKNYEKAKVELKNVIQIDPKYAEAYYLMGTVAEAEQSWQQALGLYTKATELDKEHLNAHARLGRFYLLMGHQNKARDEMELVLEKNPDHLLGRLLKAGILQKGGNSQAAMYEAQKLVEEFPTDLEAVLFLAGVYLSKDENDKVIQLLSDSIGKNVDDVTLRSLLAQVYAKNKQNDQAEQQLVKIIELEPKILTHRVTLASFYYNTQQIDKAETTLRDAIKADPDDVARYLHLADLLVSKRSSAAAEKELLAAISARPKLSGLRFGLASLYLKDGKKDRAEKIYRDIIDKFGTEPDGLKAKNKLATLLLQDKKITEAKIQTDEVLTENPRDNDALINKGKIALVSRDNLTAISAFRSVLKDQPGQADIAILLADAHLQNNEVELARETIYQAIEANPKDDRLKMSLARFMIKSRDFNNALELVEGILRENKNNLIALQLKTEALLAKNRIEDAVNSLKQLKAAHPNDAYAYLKTGQVYLAQKKHSAAVTELEQALKLQPGDFNVLTSLVQANLSMNEPQKALARLQAVLKDKPDNAGAHQLLAEVYIFQKKYDDAEKELLTVTKLRPDWDVPYTSLAVVDIRRGNTPAAIDRFKTGLNQNPGNLNLKIRLASTHESVKQFAEAMVLYEEILRAHPDNAVAVNNLAALLVDQKTDQQSLDRARKLVDKLKTAQRPAVLDTVGWVYYKTGDTDSAVRVLKQVVEKEPGVPVFHYHLGMAYAKTGDIASARKHLKTAVTSQADFPGKEQAKDTLGKLE